MSGEGPGRRVGGEMHICTVEAPPLMISVHRLPEPRSHARAEEYMPLTGLHVFLSELAGVPGNDKTLPKKETSHRQPDPRVAEPLPQSCLRGAFSGRLGKLERRTSCTSS